MKLKIMLADIIGHLGYLLSAGGAIWCLVAVFCAQAPMIWLLPAVVLAGAACGLYVMADWADGQKAIAKEHAACRKYHNGRKAA